jgi:hypothetical protein
VICGRRATIKKVVECLISNFLQVWVPVANGAGGMKLERTGLSPGSLRVRGKRSFFRLWGL